ncbi:hypothetical protein LZ30DRAFT_691920 [Colletotrichum cereale]|nr:hypothetical protein LZ30DRAFT_691920 [Colletotrichum cereale]
MAHPPEVVPGWRVKLPLHNGNPLQQQQQGLARKQRQVKQSPVFPNSTSKEQSSNCSGPRKVQEWLSSNDRKFSFISKSPDDSGCGNDDDRQTTGTSMVAHAAAPRASSDVTDDHDSVATPFGSISDRVYIFENDAASDVYFRGIGDRFDDPKSNVQPYIDLTPPFDRDANAEDHRHRENLSRRHDNATQDEERASFKAPRTSSPFDPAPSLVTDCSTVESGTIDTHQYPTGAFFALPLDDQHSQDDQHARQPKPCQSTANEPVNVEEVRKTRTLYPHPQEVPLGTSTQHKGQRSGGRGGRGGPRGGRGGGETTSGSTSHTHTASSGSSSSLLQSACKSKRQRGDDEEDDGPKRDGQDDRDPSKRARSNNGAENENIRLACPFLKRDAEKYFDCIHYYCRTTGSLKQHLKRCHSAPVHCPTCGEEFKTRTACDEHIALANCPERAIAKYDISEDKQRKLEKPCPRGTDESGRWRHIWDILFPDMKDQRPSPFQLPPLLEARVIFTTWLRQRLPDLTSDFIGDGHSEITAHAVTERVDGWLQLMGEASVDVLRETPCAHMSDDTGQESLNNTTSDHVQAGNSGLLVEPMPATDCPPSQGPSVLDLSDHESPHIMLECCFPDDYEHNHDILCLSFKS